MFIFPVIVYLALKYFAGVQKDLAEIACIYGYALSVFIPTAVLSVIPWGFFAWLTAIYNFVFSATFISRNLALGSSPTRSRSLSLDIYISIYKVQSK